MFNVTPYAVEYGSNSTGVASSSPIWLTGYEQTTNEDVFVTSINFFNSGGTAFARVGCSSLSNTVDVSYNVYYSYIQ
jgi:hypothetical protein